MRMATSGLGKIRAVFVMNLGYRSHRNTSSSFNLVSRLSLVKKVDNVGALGSGKLVLGGMMSWGVL